MNVSYDGGGSSTSTGGEVRGITENRLPCPVNCEAFVTG